MLKRRLLMIYIAWKVSKYAIYSINLRIHSECGKISTRKNSVFGHFLRSDTLWYIVHHYYGFCHEMFLWIFTPNKHGYFFTCSASNSSSFNKSRGVLFFICNCHFLSSFWFSNFLWIYPSIIPLSLKYFPSYWIYAQSFNSAF